MPGLRRTVTIATLAERVWAVVVDVERWPLSGLGWLLTRGLTRRYVETEAASIKRIAETPTV